MTNGSLITEAAGNNSSARSQKSSRPSRSQANALASPGSERSASRAAAKNSLTLASLPPARAGIRSWDEVRGARSRRHRCRLVSAPARDELTHADGEADRSPAPLRARLVHVRPADERQDPHRRARKRAAVRVSRAEWHVQRVRG